MRIGDWSSDVCSSDLGLQRLAVGRDLDPDRPAGDFQALRGGFPGFHRDAVDELVRRTDAVGPDLYAVFADRDGVAGDALAVGPVAAGFLVTLGVLDVGAGLQRLAIGGDRELNGAG